MSKHKGDVPLYTPYVEHGRPPWPNVLDTHLQRVMLQNAVITEQRITTILRPKPRWLPGFVWRGLLRKLITIEVSGRDILGGDR